MIGTGRALMGKGFYPALPQTDSRFLFIKRRVKMKKILIGGLVVILLGGG